MCDGLGCRKMSCCPIPSLGVITNIYIGAGHCGQALDHQGRPYVFQQDFVPSPWLAENFHYHVTPLTNEASQLS